MIELKELEK